MYGMNSGGVHVVNTTIVAFVISTVAVLLRLYCKTVLKAGYHLDDAWIVFALFTLYGTGVVAMWGLVQTDGGGTLLQLFMTQKKAAIRDYLVSLFAGLLVYLTVVYAIKMSILSFYQRIFNTAKYRLIFRILMGVSTAWWIGSVLGIVFNCTPVSHFWQRGKPGTCVNFNVFGIATGVLDILIDIVILVLPVKAVSMLQMPARLKVVVTSIFLLGGFVVISAIVRQRYLYQVDPFNVDFRNGHLWSAVHIMTAIVCACLPVYKPLWTGLSEITKRARDTYFSSLKSLLARQGSSQGKSESDQSHLTSETYVALNDRYPKAFQANSSTDGMPLYNPRNVITIERGQGDEAHAAYRVPPGAILRSQQVDII